MPNVNTFDRLYRRTKRGLGVTDEVVRLRLNPITADTLRVLTHITVEDKTGGYDKCRLGIESGGVDHYVDEIETVTTGQLAVARSDVLLGEGDRFFVEFTGTADNDKLILTCLGWSLDTRPGFQPYKKRPGI